MSSPLPQTAGQPRTLSVVRRIFTGLGLLFVAWFIWKVREIWLPLIIAFLIAMILDPVVDRMERRGWSRSSAASVIFLSFFLFTGLLFYFSVPEIMHQAGEIGVQVKQYLPDPAHPGQAQHSITLLLNRAHAPAYFHTVANRGMSQFNEMISRSIEWLSGHLVQLASNLIWLIIIPIVSFSALQDFHRIFAKLLLMVPRDHRDLARELVSRVTSIFAQYLRGLMVVSLLNGLATWVLLMILHMPNSFTLGAIAGILYSLPYFGAMITTLLVGGMAFIAGGIKYMLLVVGLSLLLHQVIFDQIISPRILGGRVGLHPILSITALLAGNVLLGIVGMLLAVPVAACIQMGILTLHPILGEEIPLSEGKSTDTVASLTEETSKEHLMDATEELHRSVSEAVDRMDEEE